MVPVVLRWVRECLAVAGLALACVFCVLLLPSSAWSAGVGGSSGSSQSLALADTSSSASDAPTPPPSDAPTPDPSSSPSSSPTDSPSPSDSASPSPPSASDSPGSSAPAGTSDDPQYVSLAPRDWQTLVAIFAGVGFVVALLAALLIVTLGMKG